MYIYRALNFEAFYMEIGMYIYFSYTKIMTQSVSKNYQKWPNFEKVMKFYRIQKKYI